MDDVTPYLSYRRYYGQYYDDNEDTPVQAWAHTDGVFAQHWLAIGVSTDSWWDDAKIAVEVFHSWPTESTPGIDERAYKMWGVNVVFRGIEW